MDGQNKTRRKGSKAIKAIIVLVVAVLLFSCLNCIFQPIWTDWNNYDTTYGFYKEPKNTIETLFLGNSTMVEGIDPMELYEKYGICSYNLGTESQPVMASYYLLLEAYRLHSETLDTVVLDVSGLRGGSKESFYHKSFDAMRFSRVKISAVLAYSNGKKAALRNLFPLISYHERWKELTAEDFQKLFYTPDVSTRGYYYKTVRYIDTSVVKNEGYTSIPLPLYNSDESAGETEFNEEALYYFGKIVEFCDDNDIKLVPIKLPSDWSAADHNAFAELADEYSLDFMDFNLAEYWDAIDYNFALDTVYQPNHANYYGAKKLSDYIGEYLINECGNSDIRGDKDYAFMEDELEGYYRKTVSISLEQIADPAEYLEYLIEQGDYTVLISVRDDAAQELTDEQREAFADMGLTELYELTYQASYIAAVDDGTVVYELSQDDIGDDGSFKSIDEDEDGADETDEDEAVDETDDTDAADASPITYDGALSDGTFYYLTSGGLNMGDEASIIIGDTEYAKDSQGINFVVCDNRTGKVVDTTAFNTHSYSARNTLDYAQQLENALAAGKTVDELSGKVKILYQYNEEVEALKQQVTADDE